MPKLANSNPLAAGVSAILLRWSGNRDFTAFRDLTAYPRWFDEYLPENWCCDPGEVSLIWRIVSEAAVVPPGFEGGGFTVGQPWKTYAVGAIRNGTMYRVASSSNLVHGTFPGPQLDSDIGFGDFSTWFFKGIDENAFTGSGYIGPVPLNFRLELGTVRRGNDLYECGTYTWRETEYGAPHNSDFGANYVDEVDTPEIIQASGWAGGTDDTDITGRLAWPVLWGASGHDDVLTGPLDRDPTGNSSGWSLGGCYESRTRFDSPRLLTTVDASEASPRAQALSESDLSDTDLIVLTGGQFAMSWQAVTGWQVYTGEFDPATYTPDVSRLIDWLNEGGKTLAVSAVYFGRTSAGELLAGDTTRDTYAPSGLTSIPLYFVDPSTVVDGFPPSPGPAVSPAADLIQAPIEHTNRLWAALGLSSRLATAYSPALADCGFQVGNQDLDVDPDWQFSVPSITADASIDSRLSLPSASADGMWYPLVAGGTVVATGQIRAIVRDRAVGFTTGLTYDAFDLACRETVLGSTVYVCSYHKALYA